MDDKNNKSEKHCKPTGVDVRYLDPAIPDLPNPLNVLKKLKKVPAKIIKLMDLDDFILDLILFAIMIPDTKEKEKILCFIRDQIKPYFDEIGESMNGVFEGIFSSIPGLNILYTIPDAVESIGKAADTINDANERIIEPINTSFDKFGNFMGPIRGYRALLDQQMDS